MDGRGKLRGEKVPTALKTRYKFLIPRDRSVTCPLADARGYNSASSWPWWASRPMPTPSRSWFG